MLDAAVVESEAVDECLGLRQAEHARLRVARLCAGRHRAGFEEAEAKGREPRQMRGVLVESRSESDAVGKHDPHHRDRRVRQAGRDQMREAQPCRAVEARECQIVRGFRIEREKKGAGERVEHVHGEPRAGKAPHVGRRDDNIVDPVNCRAPPLTIHTHSTRLSRLRWPLLVPLALALLSAPLAQGADRHPGKSPGPARASYAKRDDVRAFISEFAADTGSPHVCFHAGSRVLRSSRRSSRRWIGRCSSRRSGSSTRRCF